jgi:hypothetical protein
MFAGHLRFTLSASLAAGALAIALPTLGAQAARGGGFVARGGVRPHVTIPLDAVRTLVAAHHADIINGTSDANILTLMLDSNGGYVGSAATKAAVVTAAAVAPSGENAVAAPAAGARGRGGAIVAATATGPASAEGGLTVAPSGAGGTMTFAGIGTVDASLVEDLFWTNYEAGEIGPNALRVRFVILKSGVPK